MPALRSSQSLNLSRAKHQGWTRRVTLLLVDGNGLFDGVALAFGQIHVPAIGLGAFLRLTAPCQFTFGPIGAFYRPQG
jgi:hypothetical protein